MGLFLHEMKRDRLSLLIWTLAISFMLVVSIVIYPEMATQVDEINHMFSDMGAFTEAFGMDSINFGEFMGYFAVECGNVLGLGGAFYAAISGITKLSGEEKNRTVEFLLSHPISRRRVVFTKLVSLAANLVILNAAVAACVTGGVLMIGESADAGKMALIFFSYFLMQVEIALITFAISAFISRGGIGIGIGIAFFMYFMSLVTNLIDSLEFLRYLTPFGFTDAARIIESNSLEWKYVASGAVFTCVSTALAFVKYERKDIA
ncbi:MAG: ABC transporter permease subunit [Clostridia bacterium]|nr:ABC transporter permease subunit [Clostridia bacterium]